ncbi:MAG: rod shape-determining protein MreD [Lachnospiraceae bacterium]|nr:rod shape-determining protein MreD [Lachnospiraceae bacterium]
MCLLIIATFLVQNSLFSSVLGLKIIPNITVILVSAFGFMRDEKEGLLIGFICGLLYDIFFMDFWGLYAMIFMYIGFLNGLFSRIFYPEDIKLPMGLICLSDITYGLVVYIVRFLVRGRFDISFYFTRIILPEMLFTIMLSIIIYPILLFINQKLEGRELRSVQKFV